MAEGLAAFRMVAALRRREDEGAGLDGPRAQQQMPVGQTCGSREGGGHRQELGPGLRQRPVERRKAQIVADRHAEPAPGEIGQHRRGPGAEGRGFAIALPAREIDIEHVDLAVMPRHTALRVDQEGAVGAALRVELHRERSAQKPAAEIPGERATHAVCTEVLEHIEDPAILLRNAAEYMAPGCQLIVTVPGGPMCEFYRHIGHRRHYTTDSLGEVLGRAGFQVTHTYAAGFPFFNLFRVAITLRGDKLVADATGKPSGPMRAAMALFDFLFRFNLRRWGWQILAVARKG